MKVRFPLLAASQKLHIKFLQQTRKYHTQLSLGKVGPESINAKVIINTGKCAPHSKTVPRAYTKRLKHSFVIIRERLTLPFQLSFGQELFQRVEFQL
jgi:hypothetical protein